MPAACPPPRLWHVAPIATRRGAAVGLSAPAPAQRYAPRGCFRFYPSRNKQPAKRKNFYIILSFFYLPRQSFNFYNVDFYTYKHRFYSYSFLSKISVYLPQSSFIRVPKKSAFIRPNPCLSAFPKNLRLSAPIPVYPRSQKICVYLPQSVFIRVPKKSAFICPNPRLSAFLKNLRLSASIRAYPRS